MVGKPRNEKASIGELSKVEKGTRFTRVSKEACFVALVGNKEKEREIPSKPSARHVAIRSCFSGQLLECYAFLLPH